MIGDEVMGLFIPGIAGADYRRRAVQAATDMIGVMARKPSLPIGAAVNSGIAYVGNVGSEHVVDFTALGDPINIASRLQAQAGPGEVLVSDEIYSMVDDEFTAGQQRLVAIRGRDAPMSVRVIPVPN
jgi:adenylate cyclase